MATVATVGDPEKAKDRVVSRRGALWTAIAAVLAAFIGFGSAWITGTNDDARAREEFLRGQRQEVYSNFLNAADKLKTMVLQYGVISEFDEDSLTNEEALLVSETYDAASLAYSEVELVGSDPTVGAADSMQNSLAYLVASAWRDYCYSTPSATYVAIASCGGAAEESEEFNEETYTGDRDSFIEAARIDLSVEA
jgi:hypothetical protein